MGVPDGTGDARQGRGAASTCVEDVMTDDDVNEINGHNGTNGYSGTNGQDSENETLHLLVHEEYLEPVVREERRRVEVRKTVHSEPAEVSVMAFTEHATVRRHRVDREVESVPEPYWDDNTYVIPVVEEELVVTRRLVVREEVHITRTGESEQVTIPGTVRREVIDINGPVDTDGPVGTDGTDVSQSDVSRLEIPHPGDAGAGEQASVLPEPASDATVMPEMPEGVDGVPEPLPAWDPVAFGDDSEMSVDDLDDSSSGGRGWDIDEAVADESSISQRGRHRRD